MAEHSSGTVGWDANTYHRISEPQWAFGLKFLATVPLNGDETVLDAGCGTGRLTGELLTLLPRGRVIAIDFSQPMLDKAQSELGPKFGDRISFLQGDLASFTLAQTVDLVFSTATLHWVLDQKGLFASLFSALKPGGALYAQCGGAGNLERVRQRVRELSATPAYAAHFQAWKPAHHYATAEEAKDRLIRAGFMEAEAFLSLAPTMLPDRAAFREFLEKVNLRHELQALPEAERTPFLDAVVRACEADGEGYLLDYVRLNLRARRPSRSESA